MMLSNGYQSGLPIYGERPSREAMEARLKRDRVTGELTPALIGCRGLHRPDRCYWLEGWAVSVPGEEKARLYRQKRNGHVEWLTLSERWEADKRPEDGEPSYCDDCDGETEYDPELHCYVCHSCRKRDEELYPL